MESKMHRVWPTLIGCAAALTVSLAGLKPASAALLMSDTFSYPNGNLAGQGGWAAHSGAGSVPVQVTNGAAVLAQGAGSREDVNKAIGATEAAGQMFVADFDVTVTGGSTLVYFAHFKDDGTSNFRGRVFIAPPSLTGTGHDFTFGITSAASTGPVVFPTDFSFGTTYRPEVTYNFDTGAATLTVNGTTITSSDVAAGLGVTTFALRQSTGDSTETIDNLTVSSAAATPEPVALGLSAVGGVLLLGRRRRV